MTVKIFVLIYKEVTNAPVFKDISWPPMEKTAQVNIISF